MTQSRIYYYIASKFRFNATFIQQNLDTCYLVNKTKVAIEVIAYINAKNNMQPFKRFMTQEFKFEHVRIIQ